MVKNMSASTVDTRDTGLIPGLERSPGAGNGNLLSIYFVPTEFKNSVPPRLFVSPVREVPGLPLPGVTDWEWHCRSGQAGHVVKLEWAGVGVGFPRVRMQSKLGA